MGKVEIKDVKKSYIKDNWIIKSCNLTIEDGEFCVLLGPSGCGKSTLLRMIAGLEEITMGEILIDDRIVNNVSPKNRDIAMVFQNYALYPHKTVYKNLSWPLQLRKVPIEDKNDDNDYDENKDDDNDNVENKVNENDINVDNNKAELEKENEEEFVDDDNTEEKNKKRIRYRKLSWKEIDEKVMEAAKTLEIEDYLKRFPRELSGGQRQRVAVGRALVRNPKVYLFDEPLSNLDAKLRTSMRSELKLLHKKFGTTFIYVTHDQIEAMTMADKIVLLNGGYIQQVGTPKDFYNHPRNIFVGSFIGNPPMNFITLREKVDDAFKLGTYKIKSDKVNEHSEVVIGVRPEKLSFEKISDHYIEVKVKIDEMIGKEYLYYLDLPDMEVTSSNFSVLSSKEEDYSDNKTFKIYFKTEDLRYFSADESGESISITN